MSEPVGASRWLGGVPGIGAPVITASAAFAAENSQRLEASSMAATILGSGLWTFSCWCRLAEVGRTMALLGAQDGNALGYVRLEGSGKLRLFDRWSVGNEHFDGQTDALFRDPTAWYHVHVISDTGNNRLECRVNGVFQTLTYAVTPARRGGDGAFLRQNALHHIGRQVASTVQDWSGGITEVVFVGDEEWPVDWFGEFDSVGRWVPVGVTGRTYPDFSYLLRMNNGANIGEVTRGGTGDFSNVNGVTQRPDSPDDTYPLINTVDTPGDRPVVLRAGTRADANGPTQSRTYHGRGTHGVNPRSGVQFYGETTVVQTNSVGSNFNALGLYVANPYAPAAQADLANADNIVVQEDGTIRRYGTNLGTIHAAWGAGDVVGVAMWDQGVSFCVNGNWQGGEPGIGTPHVAIADVRDEAHVIDVAVYRSVGQTGIQDVNFGQNAFLYAPVGFTGWNSRNLPDAPLADPREYTETRARTGTGGTTDITLDMGGQGLSIVKRTNASGNHWLVDSERGEDSGNNTFLAVRPNVNAAEQSLGSAGAGDYRVQAPGREVSGNIADWNQSGQAYNDIHLLNDPACGVAIVLYTGNGQNNRAIPHGLGVTPVMTWIKNRGGTDSWQVSNAFLDDSSPFTHKLILDTNGSRAATGNYPTPHDATNIYLGPGGTINGSGQSYLMFVFAPVRGFSAFGAYEGNDSTDGPFVSLDFSPEWLFTKNAINNADWATFSRSLNEANPRVTYLRFNDESQAFDLGGGVDILGAGIKIRDSNDRVNRNANRTVWAAFARYPFASIAPRAV